MGYEKQNFTNGQTLTAEHLNNIEDGIVANETAILEKQSALVLVSEGFADGDDLNKTKFSNFDGNFKMFSGGVYTGSLVNAPEGYGDLSKCPTLITLKTDTAKAIQFFIGDGQLVSDAAGSSATLLDKQIWVRNMDFLWWTPWRKMFPTT